MSHQRIEGRAISPAVLLSESSQEDSTHLNNPPRDDPGRSRLKRLDVVTQQGQFSGLEQVENRGLLFLSTR